MGKKHPCDGCYYSLFQTNKEESHASLVYGASLDDAVSRHADDLVGASGGGLH